MIHCAAIVRAGMTAQELSALAVKLRVSALAVKLGYELQHTNSLAW